MKVEKSVDISATPEKIWPFLTDPAKIPLWFHTFKKCEYSGQRHSGTGTGFYVEEKVPGPLRKINFQAIIWDENKNLTLKMISGKNVNNYEISWNLKSVRTGTIFHFKEDIEMPFGILGKILGALGQRTAEKMVEAMLATLKKISENRGN
jgi:uncharacterized protein YndB with AHSA1/START domain